MAKRRARRRKFRRYLRGNIALTQLLGTLAGRVGISDTVGDIVTDTTWCSSIDCTYAMNNWTGIANAGPIDVYVAPSDYTAAEMEAYVESASSWDEGDRIAAEVRRRKVRYVGSIAPHGGSSSAAVNAMNGGRIVHTKCNFRINNGQTLRFLFYNAGNTAVGTTDPQVMVNGHANLWPM